MKFGICLTDITCMGGVETVSIALARKMKEMGAGCEIISCCGKKGIVRWSGRTIYAGVQSRCLNKHDIRKIKKIVTERAYDAVIMQLNTPHKSCMLANKRFIKELSEVSEIYITLHNSPKSFLKRYRLYQESWFSYMLKKLLTIVKYRPRALWFLKSSRRYVQKYITLSKGAYWELKKYFGLESAVCYNAIDFIEISEPVKKDNVILWAGRFCEEKNLPLLLDAWDEANVLDWRLHIIGDGSMRKWLENRTKTMSRIDVSGLCSHEDVLEQMKRSKIFVLTSFYEGFPTVITEASNMGNAIITVRYDGFSDELLKPENSICTGYSKQELAAAIQAMAGSEESVYSMGQNSYHICSKFCRQSSENNFWKNIINMDNNGAETDAKKG